jgi:hypothetical protein
MQSRVNAGSQHSCCAASGAREEKWVNRLAHALDDLASHMDVDQFALASFSEDHKEGVAAFLGRRKPQFRGR